MNKLKQLALCAVCIIAGAGASHIPLVSPATAAATCVKDADCASICGTTAPAGYTTTSFLCQSASAVGQGFSNRCVRLMAKGTPYSNVPNATYSLGCPQ